ncbi:MAG: hypothetical protein PWP23_2076 [Candidatus Sumerlaeota bacterium]|nr:hypothetical protein [Candidatus Sumerlaeota bacterium]
MPEDRLQHFLSLLSHLGWGLNPSSRPQPLGGRRRDDLASARWLALSLPDSQSLIVLAIAGRLPALGEAYKRYEDFEPGHRAVLRALRDQNISGHYLLLIGENEAQLLDLELEDVLIDAVSRAEINERLLPLLDLQALARGSLSAFPRKQLRQRARELADWTQLWSTRIGGRMDLSTGMMARLFEWLHLARVAERNGSGPRYEQCFEDFAATARGTSARRFLEDRFRPLHGQWFLLQESSLKLMLDVVQQAGKDGILDDCLASYAMLSSGKFTAEVFAEAFADDELRHRSWRSSVTGELPEELRTEEDEERDWLQEPVTLDLDRAGTVVLLRTIDVLTEKVRGAALDQLTALERGERPGQQLDLLALEPEDIAPQEAARHVLKNLLTVRTADPLRAALARLLMLTRACEWHRRFEAREVRFPRLRLDVETPAPAEMVMEEMPPAAMN